MQPTDIQVHKKEYDDFMQRWLIEVSFEVEGHDQPYMATLISEDGKQWRNNGLRFFPEKHEGGTPDLRYLFAEGDPKEIEAVSEMLQDGGIIALLAAGQ